MLRTRRPAALLSAALVLALLVGCSDETGGDESSKDKDPSSSSAADDIVVATPDGTPTVAFNKPLAKDVTEAELQDYVDKGLLPIAPAHGGAFETMTNALADLDEAPDVVLFGDSMTQQGVDPEVLGKELSDKAGSDVTAFNGASSRARWGINRMLARYLVKIDKAPKVALFAISTRAAENDLLYKTEAQKFPFSSMVEGCERESSDAWGAKDVANCEKDLDDLRHRFRAGGTQVERARSGEGAQTSLFLTEKDWLREDGMMFHPGVSEEQVRAVSDKRMERGFPGFPTVHDEAMAEFAEAAKILEDAGTTVLSFEIPYTPIHQANLDEVGRDYDKRRQKSAKTLADNAGVRHFPVKSFGDWWGDGDSRDAIHLAPNGAAKFARQLVDDTPGFSDAVLEGLED